MKKERRDVKKSKDAIKQAFVVLSMHHPINRITVNQILEMADISRGTFYAHFQDIYDVKQQVEEDLLRECLRIMQEGDIHDIVENPYSQVLRVVVFFQEHAETIRNLSYYGQGGSFFQKYKEILKKGIQESSHTLEEKETVVLLDAFIAGGIVDSFSELILGEGGISNPEKTAQIISRFIAQGMLGFRQK